MNEALPDPMTDPMTDPITNVMPDFMTDAKPLTQKFLTSLADFLRAQQGDAGLGEALPGVEAAIAPGSADVAAQDLDS